jgi:hypothetical protein
LKKMTELSHRHLHTVVCEKVELRQRLAKDDLLKA